ncbi:hypothetical protein BWI17_14620 [Betaproteobacteria bacterium GR16-43]|nr:hypothetical protein BWI17_14620 [Betaproteobacteria bacterium GR16-43]
MRAFVAWMAFACANALAAPGDLDPGFGNGGKVFLPLGDAGTSGRTIAVQADGKVLVAGSATGYLISATISRFNADGSVDTAFGSNGNINLPFGELSPGAMAVVVQPDGKIVVAGVKRVPRPTELNDAFPIAVMRLNPDGSPDATFGEGGVSTFGNSPYSNGPGFFSNLSNAMALQQDGGILLAGNQSNKLAVLRLTAQGAVDAAFGVGGSAVTDFDCSSSAIALQADGRIVTAGTRYTTNIEGTPIYTSFCVVRMLPTGAPDAGFASGGMATTTFTALSTDDRPKAVAIASDGKIVVAGTVDRHIYYPYDTRWAMVRYNADGTPDASFGIAGRVPSALPGQYDMGSPSSVALLPDGRILLAGIADRPDEGSGGTGYVARYDAAGNVDPTFGNAGFVRLGTMANAMAMATTGKILIAVGPLGAMRLQADGSPDLSFGIQSVARANPYPDSGSTSFESLLVQPDGKLIGVGYGLVARFHPDGGLDPSFGVAGHAFVSKSMTVSALQADGKIVLGGLRGVLSGFELARLNPDGSMDTGFGTSGFVATPLASVGFDYPLTYLAIQGDGKIVAATYRGTLARYNTDGSLDVTFGSGGVVIPPAMFDNGSQVWDSLKRLMIQSDGKIVLAGSQYRPIGGDNPVILRYTAAGLPDAGFGSNGRVQTPMRAGISDAALVAGQRILVTGYLNEKPIFARYLPDGSLDPSFGSGGIRFTVPTQGRSMQIDSSGRMLLGGSDQLQSRFYLTRFNPDGSPDLSFGQGGTTSARIGLSYLSWGGFAIQPNGGLVLAGTSYGASLATLARFIGGDGIVPAATDFDASGKGDLLFANTDGRAAIWLMNGTTPSSSAEIIGPGTGWSVTQMADFNGDGKTDLVWTHTDGRAALYLMNGTAPLATQQILDAGSGWSVTHTPDLNADGKADLILRHTDGRTAAWTMSGTAVTSSATILGPEIGWSVIQTADFDGDGVQDLLFRHTDGRHIIWLMNGFIVKGWLQILNAGGWTATHTPDLNGDGKADIVWRHTDGMTAVWLMDGLVLTSSSQLLGAGSGWSVTRTGDFDGDGKDDVFFQHTDGRAAIYLMNGITPTATQQILNAGSGWSAKRLVDLNGDGKADIVWEHTDGRMAVWLMNGTSMMSGLEVLGPGTGWTVSPVSQ